MLPSWNPAALGSTACTPALETLTRVTNGAATAAVASWTKMSETAFVSPATRFVATDAKATQRPSALSAGVWLAPLA